jgi:hypothetical protein
MPDTSRRFRPGSRSIRFGDGPYGGPDGPRRDRRSRRARRRILGDVPRDAPAVRDRDRRPALRQPPPRPHARGLGGDPRKVRDPARPGERVRSAAPRGRGADQPADAARDHRVRHRRARHGPARLEHRPDRRRPGDFLRSPTTSGSRPSRTEAHGRLVARDGRLHGPPPRRPAAEPDEAASRAWRPANAPSPSSRTCSTARPRTGRCSRRWPTWRTSGLDRRSATVSPTSSRRSGRRRDPPGLHPAPRRLVTEILPRARSSEHPGMCQRPGGAGGLPAADPRPHLARPRRRRDPPDRPR